MPAKIAAIALYFDCFFSVSLRSAPSIKILAGVIPELSGFSDGSPPLANAEMNQNIAANSAVITDE